MKASHNTNQQVARPDPDILTQLQAPQATLPPKLFYDLLGSTLFTSICLVPEYYQTRTEAAIFEAAGAEIASLVPPGFRLVDLGAGDCRKAASLMPGLAPAAYTPIDISADFLVEAADKVAAEFPNIRVEPLVRDFTGPWSLPVAMQAEPTVFFYPGSSIGNFNPDDAVSFLQTLHAGSASQCQLLIGVDTVKAADVLQAAYDDALGVTAAFNRNMLLNANRQLGTDFDVGQWDHRSVYNAAESRIEMHLVARETLVVTWATGSRSFVAGQTIHTENSYKYTAASFSSLLERGGFQVTGQWQDGPGNFMVMLASAVR